MGVDDEVGAHGSVAFEVYAGTTKIYDSGVMTGATATKQVDVSIAGASELRLVVTNGGDNDQLRPRRLGESRGSSAERRATHAAVTQHTTRARSHRRRPRRLTHAQPSPRRWIPRR